jgi:hypothetical protein
VRILIEAKNATLGVDAGRIVPPVGPFAITLPVPDGELRPGLINAHEHLHRNHYGRLGVPPYANAYEWGSDIHQRDAEAIARGRALPRREALRRGAWKNLLAGVTTVVHHDAWEGEFESGFPINVVPIRCAHSLRFDASVIGRGGPFAVHVAEGVDAGSANEVRELAALGWLTPELLAVHAVGPDDDGIRLLRASGAAIVWCPTSNLFLFGQTTPVPLLAPGIDVLLGSDSLLTGAGTLLDELRAARQLGFVSDDRLFDAVGATAARRLQVPVPSLEYGAPADLVVFRKPVLEATADDVAVVIVGGYLRVLDPALVEAIGPMAANGEWQRTAGTLRWVHDQSDVPTPESSC